MCAGLRTGGCSDYETLDGSLEGLALGLELGLSLGEDDLLGYIAGCVLG